YGPIIERSGGPLLGRLGRRRGWMLLTQLFVCLGLVAMSVIGPHGGLTLLGAAALVVAFASSTQDIVVDAWRIEVSDNGDELGLLSSAYQFGYRIGLLMTDTFVLLLAARVGWRISYGVYGLLMAIGMVASWIATEPARPDSVSEQKERQAPLWSPRGFIDAVVGPFIAFFRTHGWLAFVMLAAISLYRIPDYVMGPMANPFYHDLGLTKDLV